MGPGRQRQSDSRVGFGVLPLAPPESRCVGSPPGSWRAPPFLGGGGGGAGGAATVCPRSQKASLAWDTGSQNWARKYVGLGETGL